MTSSARTIRRPLLGRICSAAFGSISPASRAVPRSLRPELGFQPGADCGVGAGEDEVVEDRADVQRRSAGQHRYDLRVDAVVDRCPGQLLELGHGRGLGDVEDVEQVMRYAVALRRTDLRRTDVHAAIDLHRVRVHHLAAEAFAQGNGQVGLTGGGGADDRDDEWIGHRSSLAVSCPPPPHRPGQGSRVPAPPPHEDSAKRLGGLVDDPESSIEHCSSHYVYGRKPVSNPFEEESDAAKEKVGLGDEADE